MVLYFAVVRWVLKKSPCLILVIVIDNCNQRYSDIVFMFFCCCFKIYRHREYIFQPMLDSDTYVWLNGIFIIKGNGDIYKFLRNFVLMRFVVASRFFL